MKFVFVSFLFLVDDFDLSVSLVTRNRADQPIRPSACAKQCQERTHCAARGRLRYGTLVVLLSGGAPRANAPQRNRDPNIFRPDARAYLFSAKGAAFSASLGQRLWR